VSGVVYLHGELVPRGDAAVSVDDRGFVFGDGVYEVIRAYDGRWFEMEGHLARLARGLAGLRITAPAEDFVAICDRLLAENGLTLGHAMAYVQVTRGAAPRTHVFPRPGTPPTVYASVAPFQPRADLARDGTDAIVLPDIRWSRCDLKTINLLPNVLAKQAAADAGATEAILLRDGAVTEGSHTNVMAVVDGELRTAPRTHYILAGITRDILLRMALELGIPVSETPILAGELPRASEIFLCGTTTDVTPVVRLDGRTVGDGRPGPVARALYDRLVARIEG
jgi:D-alanine transaminase